MPGRKSVSIQLPEDDEAPRSVRTRRSAAHADDQLNDVGRGANDVPSEEPRVTGVRGPPVEKHGALKIKRRKTNKAAAEPSIAEKMMVEAATADVATTEASTGEVAAADVAPADVASAVAISHDPAPTPAETLAVHAPDEQSALAAATEQAAPAAPAMTVSHPMVPTTAAPPRAPPPPPSALASVAPEVLHALLEVCAECAADATASDLPTMGLALHACQRELQQLGVTRAPAANEAAVKLRAHEAELSHRVAELEATLRQWDEAAAPTATPLAALAGPTLCLDVSQADAARLATLPPVPPLADKLAELGALAGLCAAQVDAVSRQVREVTAQAAHERQLLGRAAKHAVFKGYVKVDEPRDLIRGLLG